MACAPIYCSVWGCNGLATIAYRDGVRVWVCALCGHVLGLAPGKIGYG